MSACCSFTRLRRYSAIDQHAGINGGDGIDVCVCTHTIDFVTLLLYEESNRLHRVQIVRSWALQEVDLISVPFGWMQQMRTTRAMKV